MNYILVLLFASICSITGLVVPHSSGRIIGGAVTATTKYPYIVSITENDRHFCSGFVYNKDWIVTTASCVNEKLSSTLKVVAGQVSLIDPDENEQTALVFSVLVYNEYNSTTKQNDIALLKLTKSLVLDVANVAIIKYNEVNPDSLDNAKIMGWGATTDTGYESINLRYGYVDIDESLTCGNYPGSEFSFQTMICVKSAASPPADGPAGSPCQYDEGSPLVQESADGSSPIVVGIMSKFQSCALDTNSVYTRLSVFYSWLIANADFQ